MNIQLRSFENNYPKIGNNVYIDPSACIIGDVSIADDVSIWPQAVIRGDVNRIHIDKMTNVQDGAILHVTHQGPFTPEGAELKIDMGVTIAHKAVLHGCTIQEFSLIGINTVILDNVVVEPRTLVAAGSLVPSGKRLKTGYLYLGNPVKQIRPLTNKEIERLEYSAQHYVRLKNKYLTK